MMETVQSLNVAEVTRIAREAARQQSPDLNVLFVTVGDGEGEYAEVIIDIENCRRDPCRLSVGVFRNAGEREVRREISDKIRRHLQEHPH